MVRYRELEVLLPQLESRGVHVQLVTSAFRPLPKAWSALSKLSLVVSIDGLQPEHDERRKPATYERILTSIRDSFVTIHCTVTGQIADRPGYMEEFLRFLERSSGSKAHLGQSFHARSRVRRARNLFLPRAPPVA